MQALSLLRISVAALILIAACAQQAPERFQVEFSTTVANGATFVIEARREYAPLGVDRFYELVNDAYYDANGFFRVLPGFVVQWGISGDPAVTAKWENQNINDDPVRMSNVQGTVAFATSGPNTRTTQLYINYADNKRLDGLGFSVFGFVVAGFDVVQKIYAGYREQPDQDQLSRYGNAYLKQYFPKLDYIIQARVISEGDARQMITRSPSQASDRQLQLQLQQQQLLARQQQQQQQLQQQQQQQQQQQEQGQEGQQQDDEQSGQQQEAQQQQQQQEQGPADEGQQENDNGSDRPPGPPGLPSNEPAQSQPHSDHILSLDEATQEANRAMERLTGHLRSMGLEEAPPRPSKEEQIAQSEETDRELDEKVKALSELHEQIRQKKAELEARSRELEEGKSAVDKLKSSFDASSRLEALLKSMKQQE